MVKRLLNSQYTFKAEGKEHITGNEIIGRTKINFRINGGSELRSSPSPPIHKLTSRLDVVSNGNRKKGSAALRSLNQAVPPVFSDSTGKVVIPLNAKNIVVKMAENGWLGLEQS